MLNAANMPIANKIPGNNKTSPIISRAEPECILPVPAKYNPNPCTAQNKIQKTDFFIRIARFISSAAALSQMCANARDGRVLSLAAGIAPERR